MTEDAIVAHTHWAVSSGIVDYRVALAAMEARVADISAGRAGDLIWLLEHPPLYSAGTSAKASDLKEPGRFPVYRTGRGGQFTYHGPGQRIVYVIVDLNRRGRDVRRFVHDLEAWTMLSLSRLGITGHARADRVGVWVKGLRDGQVREDKIAAIGIRVRRWIAFHGIAINVAPDLTHYDGIVPCGISDAGVTSLAALGSSFGIDALDAALHDGFVETFGITPVPASVPIG